ncbi:MAG: 5'-methylthioadenosine/adenosylhomocysteine nucleosidase [Alcaligenaceae bacterium]|jgi:adenosylhomocysteine nucleosidase|nr:5'-methylthioadenosine/adenosylhomocysteine nucleosidase [Alcaligenaceae bacterium]
MQTQQYSPLQAHPSTNKKAPIGIMAALEQEIAAILKNMGDNVTIHTLAERRYYVGEFNGQNYVIVLSRIGKVAAASTVTTLINKFGVDRVIFTGLAGGVHREAKVGDIVIAKSVYQYDLDASPLFPKFSVPLLNKTFFESDEELTNKIQAACTDYLENDLKTVFTAEEKKRFFQRTTPKLHLGLIGSGDLFVNALDKQTFIRETMPNTMCVEMEGAAVAQVCYEYDIPFAIFRIISDRADFQADLDFSEFLSNIAPNYASPILKRLLNYLSESVTA